MKILSALVWAACAACIATAATAVEMPSRVFDAAPLAPVEFVAPAMPAKALVRLEPMEQKRAGAEVLPDGRLRVGSVRALEKSARVEQWIPVAGGFVARFSASSAGAAGLRVKLDLGAVPGAMRVRVQGNDGRIDDMTVDPLLGPESWTPWTEGDTQLIELFSAVAPSPDAVAVGAVLHFTASPLAKVAGSCTVPTACTTNDSALDRAIDERKRSLMKLQFIDAGSAFVCSATLINTDRFPAAYVVTANHCIDNAASASTIQATYFYELSGCDPMMSTLNPGTTVNGGMQLVFSNYNVDSTLLLMNQSPPSGAVYAGWSDSFATIGTPVVSLSHPTGDAGRLALGSVTRAYRIVGYPQDMYGVTFTRGIIQGGSSGSGMFAMSNGSLVLRGILSGTTIKKPEGMSCTNLDEDALYGRFEIFGPQMSQYTGLATVAADDAPNRFQDATALASATAVNLLASPVALDGRRIDYPGDLDLYRFTLSAPAYVSAWTEGANLDTVGTILDSRGIALDASDDAQMGDNHFGITQRVPAGTFYVQVGHWDPAGTGPYNLRVRADSVDTNYTDLWWNAAEQGWGVNINHQGNTFFATLFTYDNLGAPMWLVMSGGTRQPDGSYAGELYRLNGPAFNASPWGATLLHTVGTMRFAFTTPDAGTLTYTVDNVPVVKAITRNLFSTKPSCTWSAFDRSTADNFQDLWWKDSEPGWGVNVAHQGDILFATLFTYDENGRDLWLVMSAGRKIADGSYTGELYQMRGPAFNAIPWVSAVPTQVGSMSFVFTDGNTGTLTYNVGSRTVTKRIARDVFSMPKTRCES